MLFLVQFCLSSHQQQFEHGEIASTKLERTLHFHVYRIASQSFRHFWLNLFMFLLIASHSLILAPYSFKNSIHPSGRPRDLSCFSQGQLPSPVKTKNWAKEIDCPKKLSNSKKYFSTKFTGNCAQIR